MTAPRGDPCVVVIFGAAGDLTRRLLTPALYNLACDSLLPQRLAIVGVALEALDTAAFLSICSLAAVSAAVIERS